MAKEIENTDDEKCIFSKKKLNHYLKSDKILLQAKLLPGIGEEIKEDLNRAYN